MEDIEDCHKEFTPVAKANRTRVFDRIYVCIQKISRGRYMYM